MVLLIASRLEAPSDVFSKYYDGGNPQGQVDTKSSVPQLAEEGRFYDCSRFPKGSVKADNHCLQGVFGQLGKDFIRPKEESHIPKQVRETVPGLPVRRQLQDDTDLCSDLICVLVNYKSRSLYSSRRVGYRVVV